jgi:hypothetical protein
MEPSQRPTQRRRRPDGKVTATTDRPPREQLTPTQASPGDGSAPSTEAPPREVIELRAYELYVERGCGDGYDLDDWLRAEHEVRSGGRSS